MVVGAVGAGLNRIKVRSAVFLIEEILSGLGLSWWKRGFPQLHYYHQAGNRKPPLFSLSLFRAPSLYQELRLLINS